MKQMNRILNGLFFVLVSAVAFGQNVMQLEDVIKLTVENNFDVLVAKNNEQVAHNNNNIGLVGGTQSTGGTVSGGATGMLPQISIAAGSPQNPLGFGRTKTTLQYSNPALNVSDQVLHSTSYAPSIIGTWYFFDGLKMFATRKKLNRAEELSNLQYRLAVENALLNTLTVYYQMISTKALIRSLQTSLSLANDQKELASQKFKAGSGSNVDVLQTAIDYNNIKVQIMQQQSLFNNQRISLNALLKRQPEVDFTVPDTITIQNRPDYSKALEGTEKNNNAILISRKNMEIDALGLKEFRANRFPKIGVTGNYTLSRNTNDIGLQRLNQSSGYNAGFIFSWTLLNNLTTTTAIKNQKVFLDSDNLRLEATRIQERSNLYRASLDFQNNLDIMAIERESVQLAKDNLMIASERFKIGLSNYVEYRTVEQSYEAAVYRLSQAEYAAKLSELNYLKAQGLLVR
jgi:outer membrane protein TolC